MNLKKLIIIMVALCFVISVTSPVQAAKPHTKWTMHVGEEKTYVFPCSFWTNAVACEYDSRYIEPYLNYYDDGKKYWGIRALRAGNTTIKVEYLRGLLPTVVEYCDLEILP